MTRPLLKICGITSPAFARAAESAGASYLGFIFVPSSPRAVTPAQARAIISSLSGRARTVGVFTTAPINAIAATALSLALDVVQLHAPRPPSDVHLLQRLGLEVWRLDDATDTPADAIILDGRSRSKTGGTGLPADWPRAAALAAAGRRTVLAGGLSADNLAAAYAATHASILDINSSLELSPGVKFPALLPPLFRALRSLTP
ncbi:MAG: phosphoribosylanthranilate isomerase [Kiritimatiellae bacterium]|nr:phosphoribosylanthranilate isomerase [Kiritimatiellia bacterium]